MERNGAFRLTQAGVALGMAVGMVATAAPFFWRPLPIVTSDARLGVWAAASLVAGACLLVFVARLPRHRFFAPEDIDAALALNSRAAALLQAQLQNSVEQAVLAAIAWGAWLALGPARLHGLVPIFAAYFILGRLLFALGYRRGAAARSLGFALTFYPSVALVALALPRALALLVSPG